jgi:acetyl-CoA C-acetyltransferase
MSNPNTDIVIASAARTPIGSFAGAFASVEAHELGRVAIVEALSRAGVSGEDVSELIFGQVLTAGKGQNPARQASRAAGISDHAPAWLINQVCGSGLRAVALAAQQVMTGSADVVVAGGQESMSLSAHAAYLRAGQKMGDMAFIDTMIKDTWGLQQKTLPKNGKYPAMSKTSLPLPAKIKPKPRKRQVALMAKSPP